MLALEPLPDWQVQTLSLCAFCLQLTRKYEPSAHFDVRLQVNALLEPELVQLEAGSGVGSGTGTGTGIGTGVGVTESEHC